MINYISCGYLKSNRTLNESTNLYSNQNSGIVDIVGTVGDLNRKIKPKWECNFINNNN